MDWTMKIPKKILHQDLLISPGTIFASIPVIEREKGSTPLGCGNHSLFPDKILPI